MTKIAKTLLASSLATLALAACGGDDGATHTDAPVTPPKDGPMIDAPPTPVRGIVVAGDFTMGHPGVLSTIDIDSKVVHSNIGPVMSVGDDPVVRHIGDKLFIVNRADGNNVVILDATTLAFQKQVPTGPNVNPQDVAYDGAKIYVPGFATKGVLAITVATGAVQTIDLSADDPDGKPNCNSAMIAHGALFVSCELLDDTQQFLPPRGPGKVYAVDLTSHAITATVTLGHKNPFGLFEQIPDAAPHGGDLVIPTVFFDDGTGCVERITTTGTPGTAGCVVDNAALHGYASRVDFLSDTEGSVMFLAVAASDFVHANLQGYDLTTSTLWPSPLSPAAEVIGDVAVCPGATLVVTDTTMAASGFRIYAGSAETTTDALAVGLRPTSSHGLVCY